MPPSKQEGISFPDAWGLFCFLIIKKFASISARKFPLLSFCDKLAPKWVAETLHVRYNLLWKSIVAKQGFEIKAAFNFWEESEAAGGNGPLL